MLVEIRVELTYLAHAYWIMGSIGKKLNIFTNVIFRIMYNLRHFYIRKWWFVSVNPRLTIVVVAPPPTVLPGRSKTPKKVT